MAKTNAQKPKRYWLTCPVCRKSYEVGTFDTHYCAGFLKLEKPSRGRSRKKVVILTDRAGNRWELQPTAAPTTEAGPLNTRTFFF